MINFWKVLLFILNFVKVFFNFTDFFLEKNISEIYIYFLKGYTLDQILPCPRLEYNVAGTIYVILETPTDMSDWVGTISPTLKFVVCIFNFTEFFLVNIELFPKYLFLGQRL